MTPTTPDINPPGHVLLCLPEEEVCLPGVAELQRPLPILVSHSWLRLPRCAAPGDAEAGDWGGRERLAGLAARVRVQHEVDPQAEPAAAPGFPTAQLQVAAQQAGAAGRNLTARGQRDQSVRPPSRQVLLAGT